MKEETKKLIEALSAAAEVGLIFYRAAIGSGANREEAKDLTQAYIGALMFGKGNTPPQTIDREGE